jgi:hypothetical protein
MHALHSYDGDPGREVLLKHVKSFTPFVAKRVHIEMLPGLAFFGASEANVDISCVSTGNEFNGDPAYREQVQLKLKDFVAAFLALESANLQADPSDKSGSQNDSQGHWMLDTDLRLYLSQCCLYSSDIATLDVPCMGVNPPPIDCIAQEHIEVVNAWMNLHEARSTLHYDANNNLLVVLKGAKRIYLASPALTDKLFPVSAFAEAHNHCSLTTVQAEELLTSFIALDNGSAFVVDLLPGDAIFIPEGWWHMVYSAQCSYALNFWFRSPLYRVLQQAHMLPYIMRYSVNGYTLSQMTLDPLTEHRSNNISMLVEETLRCEDLTQRNRLYLHLSFFDLITMQKLWVPFAREVSSRQSAYLTLASKWRLMAMAECAEMDCLPAGNHI